MGVTWLQADVGVLCLPPAFAAVPQYLCHTWALHMTHYGLC